MCQTNARAQSTSNFASQRIKFSPFGCAIPAIFRPNENASSALQLHTLQHTMTAAPTLLTPSIEARLANVCLSSPLRFAQALTAFRSNIQRRAFLRQATDQEANAFIDTLLNAGEFA